MGQVTVNRLGPEAMKDNPQRGDIVDYVDRHREYQPLPPDWRVIIARAVVIVVLILALMLIAGVWWIGACAFTSYNPTCDAVSAWFPRLLFGVPLLALAVYATMWWRREQAGVNRAGLVLSRWGNLQPTDLYRGMTKDQQLQLFLLLEQSAATAKLATAPYEQTPGLNSLSLGGGRNDIGTGSLGDDPPPVGPTPLPPSEWLRRINAEPDHYPHTASTGPTGSGKTTFVRAALSQRQGDVVVVAPKAEDWPGTPIATIAVTGDTISYSDMGLAVANVYAEMTRRLSEGGAAYSWLTIVIDDYQMLIAEQPAVKLLVPRMLSLGRAKRIRVWLCDTEFNVRAWGLDGRSQARENLLFTEHERGSRAVRIGDRGADGRWMREPELLDLSPVVELARNATFAERVWIPGKMTGFSASASAPPGFIVDPSGVASRQTLSRDEQVAVWIVKYGSRERARDAGCQFDNDDWTRVRTALRR